ncbi:MAG: Rne/Rng family ribonuclease [Cardiobacteriaceae bacterium]|nr:Rne/Rng family ribonuclease [Cardiobacteriaceae bacterium]
MSEAQAVEILINHMNHETRVAMMEDGVLKDVFIERKKKRGIVGNIYKGRVQRVLPGMDSAFVDIGLERAGFLHVRNIANRKSDIIHEVLHEGQSVLVQVLKDPMGSKGARLTTDVALPSRFLVHMPYSNEIGVSFKISSERTRQNLRELMAGFHEGNSGGFIVRTAIEHASFWALRADMQYLLRLWEAIGQSYQNAKNGTLIYSDLPLYLRILRDFISPNVVRVLVDNMEAYERIQMFSMNFLAERLSNIEYHQGHVSLFERYGIEEEIERSLKRQVPLKSGGYLIIDQTEAMTTIDVNTGAFVGKLSQDDTIYRTNLEAAKAIARQLRLRNLGGIVMLDFIDMTKPEHQQGVIAALESALAGDKSKYTINPMSPLGIIEMTRKRTRESLRQVMCEPCPSCEGLGYVKSAQTLVYQLFRDLMREAREFQPQQLTVVACPHLVDFIKDEEQEAFQDLQNLLNIPVVLKANPTTKYGRYDIAVG